MTDLRSIPTITPNNADQHATLARARAYDALATLLNLATFTGAVTWLGWAVLTLIRLF